MNGNELNGEILGYVLGDVQKSPQCSEVLGEWVTFGEKLEDRASERGAWGRAHRRAGGCLVEGSRD